MSCITIQKLACGCSCHAVEENAICFSCNCDYERVCKTKIRCLTPDDMGWETKDIGRSTEEAERQ